MGVPPIFLFVLVVLIGYVNGDAKRRGMRHVLWTLLAIFALAIIVTAVVASKRRTSHLADAPPVAAAPPAVPPVPEQRVGGDEHHVGAHHPPLSRRGKVRTILSEEPPAE